LIESLACHSSIKLPSGYYYIIWQVVSTYKMT
jgi:hypothetical protein